MWLEPLDGGGMALMCSSRIGNADIEGSADEMRELAKAILADGSYAAKRCGVEHQPDGFQLWSPRNSTTYTLVTHQRARDLAQQILIQLGETP